MYLIRIISRMQFYLLFLFLFSSNLFSQETSNNELHKLIEYSNQFFGLDDELINGIAYKLPDPRRDGHPYLSEKWIKTKVIINNKAFDETEVKYDCVNDEMLLKVYYSEDVFKIIVMNKINIDSIHYTDKLFFKYKNLDFVELIESSDILFMKKYQKSFIKKYNNITPFGKYSEIKETKYIVKEGNLTQVNRFSTFLKLFEKNKQKEIKRFLKSNNIKYKNADNIELKKLLKYCQQL